MFLSTLFTIMGLVLILGGANFLVDGSASVAKKYGIPDLVIGLTIVAFGTSAPELVISVLSSINGNAGLAVGNVVGSNIFNILVIIGVTALVRPIVVEKSILSNEIPLVVLSSIAMFAIGSDILFDKASANIVSVTDGIVLLLFFVIFMRYTFAKATKGEERVNNTLSSIDGSTLSERDGNPFSMREDDDKINILPFWKSAIYIVGGLASLIGGGELFVDGASGLASGLGVSDAIIGLTIVACGTSLPELATSIVAALKGQQGMAIGNVVGSCLFNVFFVLGCSASITPLPLGDIGIIDLSTLIIASILFWLFGVFYKEKTFTRVEGLIMTLLYVAYVSILIMKL